MFCRVFFHTDISLYCTWNSEAHTLRCHSCPAYTDMDWWQWKASSFLPPLLPHHQFSLPGFSPEWHLVSCFLLSPLPQRCKCNRGAGVERACPCVGGLMPITFLFPLLPRSILLNHCGQACSLRPFLIISRSLQNQLWNIWTHIINFFTVWNETHLLLMNLNCNVNLQLKSGTIPSNYYITAFFCINRL